MSAYMEKLLKASGQESQPAKRILELNMDHSALNRMKTLFEQSLFILLESMVLRIMYKTGQRAEDMAQRHANLE